MIQKIKPFLNEEGKIKQIPAKQSKKCWYMNTWQKSLMTIRNIQKDLSIN